VSPNRAGHRSWPRNSPWRFAASVIHPPRRVLPPYNWRIWPAGCEPRSRTSSRHRVSGSQAIGDAVMLVIPRTTRLAVAATALELLAVAEKYDDFPAAVVIHADSPSVRAGDWFGQPQVNGPARVRASRAPGTVLSPNPSERRSDPPTGFVVLRGRPPPQRLPRRS